MGRGGVRICGSALLDARTGSTKGFDMGSANGFSAVTGVLAGPSRTTMTPLSTRIGVPTAKVLLLLPRPKPCESTEKKLPESEFSRGSVNPSPP